MRRKSYNEAVSTFDWNDVRAALDWSGGGKVSLATSILDRHAVHVAQSTNPEAYALRTFVWLYRDEARARLVGDRETARKFGPVVAARISAEPRYPLEPWEVDGLTAGGPRPQAEVDAILLDALRKRGLEAIADRIEATPQPAISSSSGR